MARPKADYRSFPRHYFDTLNRFQEAGKAGYRIGSFDSQQTAKKARYDLYRFFTYLRDAASNGDRFALEYTEIANLVMLSLEEHTVGRWFVVLNMNPIVAALDPFFTKDETLSLAKALARKDTPLPSPRARQNPLTPPAADAISVASGNDTTQKEPNE